jgi:hypothetical protein
LASNWRAAGLCASGFPADGAKRSESDVALAAGESGNEQTAIRLSGKLCRCCSWLGTCLFCTEHAQTVRLFPRPKAKPRRRVCGGVLVTRLGRPGRSFPVRSKK